MVRKEAGESSSFPILWMEIGNDKGKRSKWKRKNAKIKKDCKHEKDSGQSKCNVSAWLCNSVWAGSGGQEDIGRSGENFYRDWKKAEKEVKLWRTRDPSELREVASSFIKKSFCLINRRVSSQIIGKDRFQISKKRELLKEKKITEWRRTSHIEKRVD